MRRPLIAAAAAAFLLSACTNSDGSTNWGNTALAGLAVVGAGAGLYYLSKQEAKNQDDAVDYCQSRYTGRKLRECIDRLR